MDLFFTNEIADGMNKINKKKMKIMVKSCIILHPFLFWSFPLYSLVLPADDSMNKIYTRLTQMNV